MSLGLTAAKAGTTSSTSVVAGNTIEASQRTELGIFLGWEQTSPPDVQFSSLPWLPSVPLPLALWPCLIVIFRGDRFSRYTVSVTM